MTTTTVDLPAFTLRGIARTFNTETRHQIPQLWDESVPRLFTLPGHDPQALYGACIDMIEGDGPDCGFVYMVGIAVDPSAPSLDGITTVPVPAGRYAIFTYDGPIAGFPQFIDAVWREHLPATGLIKRNAPDFERYDERFSAKSGDGVVDYYIPVA
ncbi:MAG: AraC family transcriptional regulator [Ignavibacteria bacterium]|nr:AraC family transcriptional regulator [Ignavibacteria bacterium]MBK7034125.1 AraC family transcriptional regulator [Ignavibacteria bacterium]MBK7576599.1 AraC family transcriptional regulator [Ignavibacteria bacterium]MBL0323222.1 AraC family transcriptional regulator [Ignavibacteria bacterium]